jgi:hypothetical protein
MSYEAIQCYEKATCTPEHKEIEGTGGGWMEYDHEHTGHTIRLRSKQTRRHIREHHRKINEKIERSSHASMEPRRETLTGGTYASPSVFDMCKCTS